VSTTANLALYQAKYQGAIALSFTVAIAFFSIFA
jgi:hypothetical protein